MNNINRLNKCQNNNNLKTQFYYSWFESIRKWMKCQVMYRTDTFRIKCRIAKKKKR